MSELSRHSRAMLLNVLWHHQGGSSAIGQAIRTMLGVGEHARLAVEAPVLAEHAQDPGREKEQEAGAGDDLGHEGERLLLDARDRLQKAGDETDEQDDTEKRRHQVEREGDERLENIDGGFGVHGSRERGAKSGETEAAERARTRRAPTGHGVAGAGDGAGRGARVRMNSPLSERSVAVTKMSR